jgi:hypothetical protein
VSHPSTLFFVLFHPPPKKKIQKLQPHLHKRHFVRIRPRPGRRLGFRGFKVDFQRVAGRAQRGLHAAQRARRVRVFAGRARGPPIEGDRRHRVHAVQDQVDDRAVGQGGRRHVKGGGERPLRVGRPLQVALAETVECFFFCGVVVGVVGQGWWGRPRPARARSRALAAAASAKLALFSIAARPTPAPQHTPPTPQPMPALTRAAGPAPGRPWPGRPGRTRAGRPSRCGPRRRLSTQRPGTRPAGAGPRPPWWGW